MQVPILSGVYSDQTGDYRSSYPVNLVPVAQSTGISDSYLRPAEGLERITDTVGNDRGGIVVNGVLYRVIGNKFARINADGSIVYLGVIPGVGQCSLCYSFDIIAISAVGLLYYFTLKTNSLAQVIDPYLQTCLYINWLDGYFISTDGDYIITSNLSTPTTFSPLNYGSSEVVPDSINSLQVLRNHLYAINRYSIEQFQNIGGQFFPFQRVDGGFIPRGAVGSFAACVFDDTIAFVGGGQNEGVGVWLAADSNMTKISTREIDVQLQRYTDDELQHIIIESRTDKNHKFLYIHLPNGSYVYDAAGSAELSTPIWFILRSTLTGEGPYQAFNFNYAYNEWFCGNPIASGLNKLRSDIGGHYGAAVGWEIQTGISYNGGQGGIFHEIEIMCLTGRVENMNADPMLWTNYSNDSGATWSNIRTRRAGRLGQREKRLNWLQCGVMNDRRIQRIGGTSDSHLTITALEVRAEALIN